MIRNRARVFAMGLTLVSLLGGSIAGAGEPGLYLSWRAPHGAPRAISTITTTCRDTSRVDTLYLTFELGRVFPGLVSMRGSLYFYPQSPDTLGKFWFFKTGWANQGNMFIDFPPFVDLPCTKPWRDLGDGLVSYDHRSGRGRLDVEFMVPWTDAMGLSQNVRYCLARVRILQRRTDLPGCAQPVCVEWGSLHLGFSTGREIDVSTGGDRFVSWNSPNGEICRSRRGVPIAQPWRPRETGNTP